jgi:hypothetical protein
MRRCTAEQSKQIKTPNVALAQEGFLAPQSKHNLFSGLLLNFFKMEFFSFVSTYEDIYNKEIMNHEQIIDT